MSFLKNPLQTKYIPTLIALIVGVMCTAIDGGMHRLVPMLVWGFIATFQTQAAGSPLQTVPFWMYVACGALFSAVAVMSVFTGAYLAAVFAVALAAFPISVVATRRRAEKTDVQ